MKNTFKVFPDHGPGSISRFERFQLDSFFRWRTETQLMYKLPDPEDAPNNRYRISVVPTIELKTMAEPYLPVPDRVEFKYIEFTLETFDIGDQRLKAWVRTDKSN